MTPADDGRSPTRTNVTSRIPFNRPCLVGRELDYMAQAISNEHSAGDGPFTQRCQLLLEELLGTHRVFLTTSGTHALEMAALLCDVGPEDEVIVPSFTFVSTAAAFALRGARIVFADIRSDTCNIDEKQLPDLITDRTKVIVPVHYGGIACDMARILGTAERTGATIVEDAAHALFAYADGKPLGTLGRLAAFSFHETKNIICGEGGALVLNDSSLMRRAEKVWHKGTDRLSFFRGETDYYTWTELGSSFPPSDLLAAFLWAQLEERDRITGRRRRIWNYYRDRLQAWSTDQGVQLPYVPARCEPSYHLFWLLFPDRSGRDLAIRALDDRGIQATFHYIPLHTSPIGRVFGSAPLGCPISEDVSGRLLRLPFFNDLDQPRQERVAEALEELRL